MHLIYIILYICSIINKQKSNNYDNYRYYSIRDINDFCLHRIRKTSKIYQVMRSETLNEILSVFLILTLILVTAYIETL